MDKIFVIDWSAIFIPSGSLLEIFVRGTLIYFICFVFLRIVRRGVGEIGITDVLIIVLIADAAQNGMSSDYKSVTEGFVLISTLVFWDYLFDYLALKSKFIQHLTRPPKIALVKDGKILRKNMQKELITKEELLSQLRLQGVEDVAEVKECYLEGEGSISVIKIKSDESAKNQKKHIH